MGKTQRSRCQGNAKHKPSVRQQISRTRREWCQNCDRKSSHVGVLCTRTARCDSWEITCFTPVVCKICSSIISRSHRGTDGMTGHRRANGRSRVPTSICSLVEKGVLPGAVQEKDPSRSKNGTRRFSPGSRNESWPKKFGFSDES